MRHPTTLMCAMAGLTTAASAGPGGEIAVLDMTGNGNFSTELMTFVGNDAQPITDAAVMGTLTLSSSDFSTLPGDLQLIDLDLMFTPPAGAIFSVDGGEFLGTAAGDLTLTGIALEADMPMPIGELGIATFSFPATLSGSSELSYSLIGIEPQLGNLIQLDNLGAVNAALDIFTLETLAGTLTVEAALFIETVSIPFEPGLVEVRFSGNIDLTATGDDPTADVNFCSRADIAEPCGMLDLADINAFVIGLNGMDPISDFDGDGLFALNDIIGFVTAFTADNCDPMGTYYCYGYAAIEFDEGNAAYAMGDHTMLTAGIALSGCALMLGFGSFRRKLA